RYDGLGRLLIESTKHTSDQLVRIHEVSYPAFPFNYVDETRYLEWEALHDRSRLAVSTRKHFDGLDRLVGVQTAYVAGSPLEDELCAVDDSGKARSATEKHCYAYDALGNLMKVTDPNPQTDV